MRIRAADVALGLWAVFIVLFGTLLGGWSAAHSELNKHLGRKPHPRRHGYGSGGYGVRGYGL